jgi:signal transduction histidine kinase
MEIIAVNFFYGLAFFGMGIAVALESRRESALALSRHLPWLAAFGLVHSLVEWFDMFDLIYPTEPWHALLDGVHILLLPLSALLLIRFGVGLVSEAGPLPEWLTFVPIIILVPLSLLVAYALVMALTGPSIATAADVWSRYLLYLPGCLLAGYGFLRQWHGLSESGLSKARGLLFGASLALFFNAIVAGLVVPAAPYGLAPWINYDRILRYTGVPVQVWRAMAAIAVAFFVVRAMGVFEIEREQQLEKLRIEREQAQAAALSAQRTQRETAENWTNGFVDISRRIANFENVDKVLGATVELARKLIASDTAALALWNEKRTELELKCYANARETQNHNLPSVSNPIVLNAVLAGTLFRFPEDAPAQTQWLCPVLAQPIDAAAIVPLRLENQVIGGLWVARLEPRSFTETDLVGLERLADQAVIALEYAVMTARLQSLAVTDERSRIAREMHDGLLQILGYLGLQTQTIDALLRQNNREAAVAELGKMRESIIAAQADVRENVMSLRTTLAGDAGLIESLQDYIAEFQIQTQMRVELVNSLQAEPRLSPLAEAQLVRIIQEALANVRKHARAT